MGKFNR